MHNMGVLWDTAMKKHLACGQPVSLHCFPFGSTIGLHPDELPQGARGHDRPTAHMQSSSDVEGSIAEMIPLLNEMVAYPSRVDRVCSWAARSCSAMTRSGSSGLVAST